MSPPIPNDAFDELIKDLVLDESSPLLYSFEYMSEILILALTLAIVYQLKHFVADYLFQNTYMLQKGNADWSFFKPLLAHSLVHGVITFILSIYILRDLKWAFALFAFDTCVHFVMDRVKAAPQYLGRYTLSSDARSNQIFWIAFGFDQMVHHLTHLAIIAAIVIVKFQSQLFLN